MSEMSYEENYDYSQDVCTPEDAPAPAEPAHAAPHEIYDPPIEHDPIGQALIGLPFAVATGIGEAAVEGAEVVGAVGKEVISWGLGELGIGAAESATE
ncbi:MAG: hypothetical protein QOD41_4261 [Cryptosporangiaceae bacterium]|nr:hypothetical protein [Cryptosporangiaceae bacterium]